LPEEKNPAPFALSGGQASAPPPNAARILHVCVFSAVRFSKILREHSFLRSLIRLSKNPVPRCLALQYTPPPEGRLLHISKWFSPCQPLFSFFSKHRFP
jgi:hypothetical protein